MLYHATPNPISCCTMLHHATPCHTMPHHATLHHAAPCHTTPYHTMLHYTMPHHATPCYTMPHHATPCYTTPRHTMIHYTMSNHATLCFTTLLYILTQCSTQFLTHLPVRYAPLLQSCFVPVLHSFFQDEFLAPLELKRIPVPADHNCLFHAMSLILYGQCDKHIASWLSELQLLLCNLH